MTTSEEFFQFLSPSEIYQKITGGPGTSDLVFAQAQANNEWSAEEGRADLIKTLADTISSGWEGQASAHAYGAALPLRERTLQNATYLERSQDLLSRQVGSFERAYNGVLPVPEVPRQSLEEPIPFDVDHAKEVALYQGIAQHNMDVFGQYDGASEYNETNMPQEFHAGGRDGGDVSVRSADTIEVGEPRPGGAPRDEVLGGPGDTSGPGDTGGPGGPGGGFPGGSSSGYPGTSGGYPGSGGLPEGIAGSSGGVTEASGGGVTGASDYRPEAAGGFPSSGYSSSLPGGGGAVSPGPGGVPVGGYSGGGGAGGGGGVPRMSGGGGGAGNVAGPLRGPGNSAGIGAIAAEQDAVRRGAVGSGSSRGSAGAMGAPLGGKGKGDEDVEHERKVLIEADPEETFGSEVLTAPPVIGDDEYED